MLKNYEKIDLRERNGERRQKGREKRERKRRLGPKDGFSAKIELKRTAGIDVLEVGRVGVSPLMTIQQDLEDGNPPPRSHNSSKFLHFLFKFSKFYLY